MAYRTIERTNEPDFVSGTRLELIRAHVLHPEHGKIPVRQRPKENITARTGSQKIRRHGKTAPLAARKRPRLTEQV